MDAVTLVQDRRFGGNADEDGGVEGDEDPLHTPGAGYTDSLVVSMEGLNYEI